LRCLILCVLLSSAPITGALAQATPERAIRAPDVPNPRGTDSGAGPACNQLTTYGNVQPPGPPALPYGLGAPAPTPVAPPVFAAAAPARANSTLGASGAASRGIIVPDVPLLPYAFVEPPHPPSGSAGFANVNGVGLLKNGRLIVNQRMPMYQLMEYDSDGRLTRIIDPNLVARPHGMRIDGEDNIWITDQQCNIVVKLSPNGEVLLTLGTAGKAGTWDEAKGDHLFNQPTDIGFASNGDVFVANGHGGPDPRVLRFDKRGKFITSWSMQRNDPSQAIIHTLIVNKKNEVYVGDRELKLIKVFDVNGKLLRQIQMQNLICGFYVDARNQLWMTTGQDGMILRLDWDGKVLGRIGKEGFGANDFGEAHYMTITPDGETMYVSDTVNNDIKKLKLVR
jgi:sugar lactone lactonase YvrE